MPAIKKTTPNTIKKCVIYARVSSDRQEREGFSIPAQLKLLKEYAQRNNIKIVQEFVESETAKKAGRKQFNEMIKFLKKNTTIKSILVEKTDRLYRNLKDYVTLDEFTGLEIHFVKEGEILSASSKSQDKFMHGIRVLMAKNYIDNLSEEIQKGLKEKCEQGYCPTRAPIGYLNVIQTSGKRTIEVDKETAPFIKRIFEEYLTGNYTYKTLAQYINNAGFKPRNKQCTGKTIENILHQEFYTGNFIFKGKKYYNGQHTPLITPELFAQVQEKLRKKNSPRARVHNFAYTQFIRCAKCGKYMTAEIQHGAHNSGDYIYYKCRYCKKTYLKQEEIEQVFKETILDNIEFTKDEIAQIIEVIKELVKMECNDAIFSVEQINKRVVLLEKRLEQLYTDKVDGAISENLYIKKRDEWQNELDELLIKYEKTAKAGKEFIGNVELLLNLCKDAPRLYLNQTPHEKRKLMNLIVSNPIFDGSKLTFTVYSAFEYALKLKNLVIMGTESNPKTKLILIEMMQNYNNLNFETIKIFKKCA